MAKKVTAEQIREAERTLTKLLRCRVIYPPVYGIICKKTRTGPFYLAKKSKTYRGLKDEVPQVQKKGKYRGCFITVLQDSCLNRDETLSDWLKPKVWRKT